MPSHIAAAARSSHNATTRDNTHRSDATCVDRTSVNDLDGHVDAMLDTDTFSRRRMAAYRCLQSRYSDIFLATLIFFNLIIVVDETDSSVAVEGIPWWITVVNNMLLAIFSCEIALRLYVFRLVFFRNLFNWLDVIVVLVDAVFLFISLAGTDDAAPSFSVFRIFRLMRLARSVKVIVMFPQLALIVKGLLNAFKSIFWGVMMVALIIVLWSIIAVQLVHSVNIEVTKLGLHDSCERCPRAFASVGDSALTFIQHVIAGDSWGIVTIPIIEFAPWSAWFFGCVFITLDLAILNVILAVIVDSAFRISSMDDATVSLKKEQGFQEARGELLQMCAHIDKDNNGLLHFEEILEGCRQNSDFRHHLRAMDIKEGDLEVLFRMLDADNSGFVEYHEFVEELYKVKSHDSHTLLIFIKYFCTDIRDKVQTQMQLMEEHLNAQMCKLDETLHAIDDRVDRANSKISKFTGVGTMNLSELSNSNGVKLTEDQKLSKDISTPLLHELSDDPWTCAKAQLRVLVASQEREQELQRADRDWLELRCGARDSVESVESSISRAQTPQSPSRHVHSSIDPTDERSVTEGPVTPPPEVFAVTEM